MIFDCFQFHNGDIIDLGENHIMAPKKGWKPPLQWIEAHRKAQTGRKHTEETKEKISNSNKGKTMSPESRKKMSDAKKGKPMSASQLENLKKGISKGKLRSEETKRKMSIGSKRSYTAERLKSRGEQTKKFWASLTLEEKRKITLPGRLACLKATRTRTPTSIEKTVSEYLTKRDIVFKSQFQIGYYIIDIYIPEYKLVIECDGDYWHSTPKMISHDKKKDAYLKNHGYKVIRLQEHKIKENVHDHIQEKAKEAGWQL